MIRTQTLSLRELDFGNTGSWPWQYRVGLCILVGALVLAMGWWLLLREQRAQLRMLELRESELRIEYQDKQARAVNLAPLKWQLAQLQQRLQHLLQQLPDRTEMPDLIVDISQTASAAGLASDLLQPGGETSRQFYAEKPIALRMAGTYHQIGAFVSGIASLPGAMILTMHDIALRPKESAPAIVGGHQILEFTGTVKAYRYLDKQADPPARATTTGGASSQSVTPPSGKG